jgi:hypothetical protein
MGTLGEAMVCWDRFSFKVKEKKEKRTYISCPRWDPSGQADDAAEVVQRGERNHEAQRSALGEANQDDAASVDTAVNLREDKALDDADALCNGGLVVLVVTGRERGDVEPARPADVAVVCDAFVGSVVADLLGDVVLWIICNTYACGSTHSTWGRFGTRPSRIIARQVNVVWPSPWTNMTDAVCSWLAGMTTVCWEGGILSMFASIGTGAYAMAYSLAFGYFMGER